MKMKLTTVGLNTPVVCLLAHNPTVHTNHIITHCVSSSMTSSTTSSFSPVSVLLIPSVTRGHTSDSCLKQAQCSLRVNTARDTCLTTNYKQTTKYSRPSCWTSHCDRRVQLQRAGHLSAGRWVCSRSFPETPRHAWVHMSLLWVHMNYPRMRLLRRNRRQGTERGQGGRELRRSPPLANITWQRLRLGPRLLTTPARGKWDNEAKNVFF